MFESRGLKQNSESRGSSKEGNKMEHVNLIPLLEKICKQLDNIEKAIKNKYH